MDQKLKSIVDTLWKNWAFRLSLSSNELFHSNIIQFLAESSNSPTVQKGEDETQRDMECSRGQNFSHPDNFPDTEPLEVSEPTFIDIESARRFMQIFCVDAALVECEMRLKALDQDSRLQVVREKGGMDLTVLIPTEKAKSKQEYKPLFALEVKVKAYPDATQLARYRKYLNAKWTTGREGKQVCKYRPPLVLLTGMGLDHLMDQKIICRIGDSRASQVVGHELAYGMNFSDLEGRLRNSGLAVGPIGTEYLALCSSLQQLFTALELRLKNLVSFNDAEVLAKELEPYRLHALWWKLWAADHARACTNAFDKADGVKTYSGFTRTGNFGVCRKWTFPENSAKPEKAISIGLQVEGDSLRFFLNVVHPLLGARDDARLKVEGCLLRLIQDGGIFARVPGIDLLVSGWHAGDMTLFHNGARWQQGPAFPAQSGSGAWPELTKLFEDGKAGLGRAQRTRGPRPMLTGYANGQGNGFADLRIKLKRGYTREDVVALSKGVLIENAFSRVEKGPPSLLKNVVDDFAKAPESWLENLLPDLRTQGG